MRWIILTLSLCLAWPLHAQDEDLNQGYYYPELTSRENFTRILVEGPEANKATRVSFVTEVTAGQLSQPANPRLAVFAKGSEAEKLIIFGLDGESFKTLFRARGVLAQVTSGLRAQAFLADQNLQYEATFFDLLQMMQFESLVVSDRETWAHKVFFVRE